MIKTLGILGGGQLGQMSAKAAQKLGIDTIIFTPEENGPASTVAGETIVADYTDQAALTKLAEKCDAITYEFENIPLETIEFLAALKPVFPDIKLLRVSQDRIIEKTFLNEHNIPTARWAEIHDPVHIQDTLKQWKTETCIIKTTRFGYDGKGQAFIHSPEEAKSGWDTLNTTVAIAEEVVDFECEISVIVARDKDGNIETYGPCHNDHKNHILHKTTIPAQISKETELEALDKTKKLAEALNLQGVLTLEMFVTKDGNILANEIAPRTHNSGHWSIDACAASQFENHVRAVCNLNIAAPGRHSDCEMINLIGDDIHHLESYKNRNNIYIHNYGKAQARPGRKMGHVTILTNTLQE